jgi:hypothetical protein
VAQAVLFLADPRSISIAGMSLDVDAGVTHLRVRAQGGAENVADR